MLKQSMRQVFVLPFFLFMGFSMQLLAELPPKIVLTPFATYPHDAKAFTQGLFFSDGFLYESTGQYGQSTLRKVDSKTGQILAHVDIPRRYFAEGLALADGKMYQLTWQEKVCFVFDVTTLKKTGDFHYKGEGWGLTFDGKDLIMSDGTSTLKFIDPATFKTKRKINIFDKPVSPMKSAIQNLNELEYIHGEIWANVWQTTKIVRINPQTGQVIGWIEMSAFVPQQHKEDTQNCVLNGIAFDPATNHVYITGKYWDVMYVLKLENASP